MSGFAVFLGQLAHSMFHSIFKQKNQTEPIILNEHYNLNKKRLKFNQTELIIIFKKQTQTDINF